MILVINLTIRRSVSTRNENGYDIIEFDDLLQKFQMIKDFLRSGRIQMGDFPCHQSVKSYDLNSDLNFFVRSVSSSLPKLHSFQSILSGRLSISLSAKISRPI